MTNNPTLYLLDASALTAAKSRIHQGDAALQPAYARLQQDADTALSLAPLSVMDKSAVPPSGDKHDYYSVGPYWWPNPDTEDGLPYVRRDGEVNPERENYDSEPLKRLIEAVDVLALMAYYSGEIRYTAHAAQLLRTWFLDEATRMNPHLEYGQAIPGICEGRGIGIIDTRLLSRTVDATGLLRGSDPGSREWTAGDERGMVRWFRAYLNWLLTSKHGRDEASEHNNHGTWYDVQAAAMALRLDDRERAYQILSQNSSRRIASHVDPNGSQPKELVRTRSLSYSVMNLIGMMDLASLGRHVGVDLWQYSRGERPLVRLALDWLIEHALEQEWTREQITAFDYREFVPALRRAALAYHAPEYEAWITRLPIENANAHRAHLLYPAL